jgi:anti-anti-sigma factor
MLAAMTYKKSCSTRSCVVSIAGRLGPASASAFAALERELTEPQGVVIDVAGLEGVDQAFLGFLLRLRRRTDASRRAPIRLVGVRPDLQRVLDVTGMSRMIPCENAA